jgi:predicted phosphodiesterase
LKIAALYDVHGNAAALEAVLADVPDDATILLGGDVAAGAFPHETLERLRALGGRARWLRGNADRELTPGEQGRAPAHLLEWMRGRLSEEEIAFLHALPPRLEVDVDGVGRVLFVHATPQNDVDVFTEVTPADRVAPAFEGVAADLVVCGHTHTQFDRMIHGTRVVNAGSVGMPHEDTPGAYWALIGPDVRFRCAAYEPDYGDFPEAWPSGSRAEATRFFESVAVGA